MSTKALSECLELEDMMSAECNCDPTTAQLTEEYLPVLLSQYDFKPEDFTPEQLEEIRSLLLVGELTKARGILSDWAYECNAGKVPNGEQDCQLCGERVKDIHTMTVIFPFGDCCKDCAEDVGTFGTSRVVHPALDNE